MDNELRMVRLGKGEAKLITALRKLGTDIQRFGHAMLLKRTVVVTDGYSLVLSKRGEFLKDVKSGRVEFGPTPSGASATTLWEYGDLPSGIGKGVSTVLNTSMNGKFAVIDVDPRLLVSLLQGIIAVSPSQVAYDMVRIGIRADESGDFWGDPSTNPIVISKTDCGESLSPLVAILMPIHPGGREKRKDVFEELLGQFKEDVEMRKEEQEKSDEN